MLPAALLSSYVVPIDRWRPIAEQTPPSKAQCRWYRSLDVLPCFSILVLRFWSLSAAFVPGSCSHIVWVRSKVDTDSVSPTHELSCCWSEKLGYGASYGCKLAFAESSFMVFFIDFRQPGQSHCFIPPMFLCQQISREQGGKFKS